MKWLLCVLGLVLFYGCDTPYTGFLGAGDIDGYLEGTGDETVCLADGFDSVCIKMIPGKDGKDGKDGVSIVGPQGPPGEDGKDGNRGRHGVPGRRGEDGAIVIVETPYLLLRTDTGESFTLMISHGIPEATSDTYVTPVATVEVPVGGGEPRISSENKPVEVSPVVTPPVVDNGEIWHVMYRVENGQATVFVYPRAVLDPVTVNLPQNHVSGDTHGIDLDTVFNVGRDYNNEMQGDRESVRYLLEIALAEDNVTLVDVGGVHGVVN